MKWAKGAAASPLISQSKIITLKKKIFEIECSGQFAHRVWVPCFQNLVDFQSFKVNLIISFLKVDAIISAYAL